LHAYLWLLELEKEGDSMKITLEGKPISKMRARHANHGRYVVTYDPQSKDKESVRWKLTQKLREALDSEIKEISMDASNLAHGKIFEVDLWFYLPVNNSDSEAQKNAKLWGFEPATCKPDYDNLEKFYLDAANGVLWEDDRMIIDAHAHKRYGEPARVEMTVMAKDQMKLHPKAEAILKIFSPGELEEFLEYATRLSLYNYNYHIMSNELFNKEKLLTNIAVELSKLAAKYADKLKKIRKYEGLESDLKELEMTN
jgi:Holliday junction resolvase RusA-like endonuclease